MSGGRHALLARPLPGLDGEPRHHLGLGPQSKLHPGTVDRLSRTVEGESLEEDALVTFCRDRLAHFKCPTKIRFVEELPRTATGKLQKYKLREAFWGGDRRVN